MKFFKCEFENSIVVDFTYSEIDFLELVYKTDGSPTKNNTLLSVILQQKSRYFLIEPASMYCNEIDLGRFTILSSILRTERICLVTKAVKKVKLHYNFVKTVLHL